MTRGLTGVTNGSPWLGRSKGVARLIHGIQRCMSTIPLARVNSQFEPVEVERKRAGRDHDGGRGAVGEHAPERHDDRLVVDAWLDARVRRR